MRQLRTCVTPRFWGWECSRSLREICLEKVGYVLYGRGRLCEGGACIDSEYCVVEVMFAVVCRMNLGDGSVIAAFVVVAVDVVNMDGDVVRSTNGDSKPVLAMAGVTGRLCKLQWNEYA